MNESLLDRIIARDWLPDAALRIGIRRLLAQRLREIEAGGADEASERLRRFVEEMRQSPVAIATEAANEQHYEVPTGLYQAILGKRLKYSSALWPKRVADLDQAEEAMLTLTSERAGIADGQRILELGCGWGSLTLWMAEQHPTSTIVAVSNSRTQKEHIDASAKARGLANVEVRVADMVEFDPGESFDRIVSVEMFEHMRNWETLFSRVASWLRPGGAFFLHVFSHARAAYAYEDRDASDWMARYFFTGGMMPADALPLYFQRELQLAEHWRVSGLHYAKTCEAWIENMDRNEAEVRRLLAETYGADQAVRWWVYWRVFFLACAELFHYRGGREWAVSHYRFELRS